MVDLNKAREDAQAKKIVAKSLIESARRTAIEEKQRKKYPKYVDMPQQTRDAEVDSMADLDELQKGFRERAKDEANRFKLTTDSEYWSVLCFQSREQRDAFFAALKISDCGDTRYFDGVMIAKRLGIDLPSVDIKYNPTPKTDKTWEELT